MTVTLQIKVDAEGEEADKQLGTLLNSIETPIGDKEGNFLNHLLKYGYEIMIMDRKEGPWVR